MKRTVVGVDIAKRVFQLHWVELDSGEMISVQLKRAKFLEHCAWFRRGTASSAHSAPGAPACSPPIRTLRWRPAAIS